ncbi:MAG: cadmium-translocating P-type ATPase [Alphaproteobacteria bacterium]|nr:cadmium-translocating P-type ATPase [Alphaproteobacteria bacterium]
MDLHVPGISCAGCISKIERGVRALPGIVGARVNFTTRRLAVDWEDAALSADRIVATVTGLGFEVRPFAPEEAAKADDHGRTQELIRAMVVAGFAATNIMLLSISIWSGAAAATRDLFHAISAAIALPAVIYAVRPFARSAWSALRHGRTNMDVPICIGVALATGMSLYETLTRGAHAYFDGVTMLLFFLLIGRVLDSVMRDRARAGVAQLLKQTPRGALALMADGSTEWRPIDSVAPGMRVLVAAGERLPVDGIVEAGTGLVDRALVTGESAPEPVAPGDRVLAGTLSLDAALTVKTTAAGEATFIADLVRLMEAAEQSKSAYVRLADRVSRLYAPAVHLLAALTCAGWLIAGFGWHAALTTAIAVLIITCPCALGLAVPAVQVTAAGRLMKRGILLKDGGALERLAEVDIVMLDKTGTITRGRPVLDGIGGLAGDDAAAALALAQRSTHPLARALAAELAALGVAAAEVRDVREVPGCGVEGIVDGAAVRLGRPDWVDPAMPRVRDSGRLVTAVRRGGGDAALVRFRDELRPNAAAAIADLRDQGCDVAMLSGDRAEVAADVATSVGIRDWQAGCAPAAKVAAIAARQSAGRRVLVVGDGLNDGPALAAGHASMAPASASDVGQAAADLVFLGDGLDAVPAAVRLARRARRLVRQNIAMAVVYNAVAVPLAIAGVVTPLIAAVAMSSSSVLVIGNALRLRIGGGRA